MKSIPIHETSKTQESRRFSAFLRIFSPSFPHTISEVIQVAKQGMKRPQETHTQPRNELPPVPELQGSAKRTKTKAKPLGER